MTAGCHKSTCYSSLSGIIS